jgi:hypothetical protein
MLSDPDHVGSAFRAKEPETNGIGQAELHSSVITDCWDPGTSDRHFVHIVIRFVQMKVLRSDAGLKKFSDCPSPF